MLFAILSSLISATPIYAQEAPKPAPVAVVAPSPKKRAKPNPANFKYKHCTEAQKKDKRRHCK